MTGMIEGITLLGEHIGLVVVGCLELLAALFLFVSFLRKKMGDRNPVDKQSRRREEKLFLQEMRRYRDGACILLRRSDSLPLYAEGDPEDLLGTSLQQLQEDIPNLFGQMPTAEAGEKL